MPPSKVMAPKAIVFDWDNTLIDAWPCILACYNHTFRHFGMNEWSLEEGKKNIARSLRDSFPEMFGNRWEEARDIYYQSFRAVHLEQMVPFPGAVDVLAQLKDLGIYLAVVSNKTGTFLRDEAQALGWTDYFGTLVGALDAPRDKPDPDPVKMALAPGGIEPGPHVWFVGDSAIDLECGAKSGCVSVLMRPEPPLNGEFIPYPPDQYAKDSHDLLAKIRELPVFNTQK